MVEVIKPEVSSKRTRLGGVRGMGSKRNRCGYPWEQGQGTEWGVRSGLGGPEDENGGGKRQDS